MVIYVRQGTCSIIFQLISVQNIYFWSIIKPTAMHQALSWNACCDVGSAWREVATPGEILAGKVTTVWYHCGAADPVTSKWVAGQTWGIEMAFWLSRMMLWISKLQMKKSDKWWDWVVMVVMSCPSPQHFLFLLYSNCDKISEHPPRDPGQFDTDVRSIVQYWIYIITQYYNQSFHWNLGLIQRTDHCPLLFQLKTKFRF